MVTIKTKITLNEVLGNSKLISKLQKLKIKCENIEAIFLCGGLVNRGFSYHDIDLVVLLNKWKNLGYLYDYSDNTKFQGFKLDIFPRDKNSLRSQKAITRHKPQDNGLIKIL